jgi:hypothetical protein
MKLNRRDKTYQHCESKNVDGHIFHRITQFKYLGVLLNQNRDIKNNSTGK